MDVIGHGLDIVEVDFFTRLCEEQAADELLARQFTPEELAQADSRPNRAQYLAGRFAAKEAVLKALGVGWTQDIAWTDVKILSLASGAPNVVLKARCAEIAVERGITSWEVSITHTTTIAAASVIALSSGAGS